MLHQLSNRFLNPIRPSKHLSVGVMGFCVFYPIHSGLFLFLTTPNQEHRSSSTFWSLSINFLISIWISIHCPLEGKRNSKQLVLGLSLGWQTNSSHDFWCLFRTFMVGGHAFSIKMSEWGLNESSVVRALALHATDLSSVPCIPYDTPDSARNNS